MLKSAICSSALVCLLAFGALSLPMSHGRESTVNNAECFPMFSDKNPGPAVVRLELRIAEQNRAEGLTEAIIECTDEKIYLHKEVLVSNQEIAEASVVVSRLTGESEIALALTKIGAGRLEIATSKVTGKRMAIIINGTVLSAPTIQSPLSDSIRITGRFGDKKETAERFVTALRRK